MLSKAPQMSRCELPLPVLRERAGVRVHFCGCTETHPHPNPLPEYRERGWKAPRAFTLAELLVVIGVIALLVGILLPALSSARESSRAVACLSNLRQIVAAAHAYAVEQDGRYPIAQYRATEGSRSVHYCWDFTTIVEPGQPPRVVPGLIWRTGDLAKVQQCPSYDGRSSTAADPYTGYNYNTSYIGHGEGESVREPARVSLVRRPAETAIFGDGQWAGGANKYMRAPFPHPGDTFTGRTAGTQGFRHKGRTNVAFCDGHAEALDRRFTDNADGAAGVAPGTGFLSADNSLYDLQ
jgi:prepilin-type processing-associated H-X9-DG protein/prepilin-type N-terminal cleavage/methylation domain-containing protein